MGDTALATVSPAAELELSQLLLEVLSATVELDELDELLDELEDDTDVVDTPATVDELDDDSAPAAVLLSLDVDICSVLEHDELTEVHEQDRDEDGELVDMLMVDELEAELVDICSVELDDSDEQDRLLHELDELSAGGLVVIVMVDSPCRKTSLWISIPPCHSVT